MIQNWTAPNCGAKFSHGVARVAPLLWSGPNPTVPFLRHNLATVTFLAQGNFAQKCTAPKTHVNRDQDCPVVPWHFLLTWHQTQHQSTKYVCKTSYGTFVIQSPKSNNCGAKFAQHSKKQQKSCSPCASVFFSCSLAKSTKTRGRNSR